MAASSFPLARKFPLLSRFVGFSRKPVSPSSDPTRIPAIPAQMREFRSCSLCHYYLKEPLSFSHGGELKRDFGCFTIALGQFGYDGFRVSAVSDGGSGGAGGSGDGHYGGGGEGSGSEGGGGGGEKNWSLLSW